MYWPRFMSWAKWVSWRAEAPAGVCAKMIGKTLWNGSKETRYSKCFDQNVSEGLCDTVHITISIIKCATLVFTIGRHHVLWSDVLNRIRRTETVCCRKRLRSERAPRISFCRRTRESFRSAWTRSTPNCWTATVNVTIIP